MSNTHYYTITAGDTLWKIAQKLNTTVAELVRLNQFSHQNVTLHIGQQLLIPSSSTIPPISHPNSAANIEKLIQWFQDRKGKVGYSMPKRLGPSYYDCSSAVFSALIYAGFLKQGTYLGNTDDLFKLENQLLIPISPSQVRRGDLFISGVKFNSAGSNGHTGIFLNSSTIIHCTPYYNGTSGIVESPLAYGKISDLPTYYYRLKGSNSTPSSSTPTPTPPSQSSTYYIIVAGDTLWKIAQKFNTTVAELVKLNQFPHQNVTLHIGQQLLVKKGQNTPQPPTPTPPSQPNSETVTSEYAESGQFTANRSLAIRNQPNEASPAVATLNSGEKVTYDRVYLTTHFVYISYISYSGTRRYIAIRTFHNQQRGPIWGTIV